MRQLFRSATMLGAACATLTTTLVVAQVQEPARPQGKVTVTTTVIIQNQAGDAKQAVAVKEAITTEVVVGKVAVPAQGKIMRAVKAGVPVAADIEPQVQAQAQQFAQQFRPILQVELHFLRAVCKMSPEQAKLVARDGAEALKDVVGKYTDIQRKLMLGQWRGGVTYPDARKVIQEGLAKAVKARLSPEQAAHFVEEIGQRESNRRRVAIQNLVARLDQDMFLSVPQRDKIGESLTAHWNDAWCQSLEMFLYNDQFFPNIPNQHVVPFLNPNQKKIWDALPKNGNVFFGNMGFGLGMMEVENDVEIDIQDVFVEAVPALAPAPAPVKEVARPAAKAAEKQP